MKIKRVYEPYFIEVENIKDSDDSSTCHLLPDSLNLSTLDKDETLHDFGSSVYFFDSIDCIATKFQIKSRILSQRNESVFIWLNGGNSSVDYKFKYLFMELHDISIFSIVHIRYHLIDSNGKRMDNYEYSFQPGYDTNDCIRLVCAIPRFSTSTDYSICIDEVAYQKSDGFNEISINTNDCFLKPIPEKYLENANKIETIRKPILKNAKETIAQYNKGVSDRDDKALKFGVEKIPYKIEDRRKYSHLYKKQESYKHHYERIFPEDVILIKCEKALDKLYLTYPELVFDDDNIRFEFSLDTLGDSFFGLAALLEDIPIDDAFINDNGKVCFSFKVSVKNTWLLTCLNMWNSTQRIHGPLYGYFTGEFYEAEILKCIDRNRLENLNADMTIVDQNLNESNDIFNMAMDRYYAPIINERYIKYTKRLPVWKSELYVYLMTKFFFNDAIHVYSADWLGKQTLDVYVPSKKLAIEYQGEQHYFKNQFNQNDKELEKQQERDKRKVQLCIENGVDLIEIDYEDDIHDIYAFVKTVNNYFREEIISLENIKKDNDYGKIYFRDLLKNIHGNH